VSINLSNKTSVRPGIEHGSVAAARIPFIGQNDSAGLQRAATQLGFTSVGTDQYQHPKDKSWVVMNQGRLERGVASEIFAGKPVDLAALPMQPPGAFGAVAAQALDPSLSATRMKAELTKLGFTQVLPTYFVHPDQSWVAVVQDLGVVRGVGQQQMDPSDVVKPSSGRARSSSATGATASARAGSTRAGRSTKTPDAALSMPKVNPTFEDGFLACAQIGFLNHGNRASDAATFQQLGFKETVPGLFEHPDTSFVAYTTQGTIERGAGTQVFQRVPQSPQRLGTVAAGPEHLALALNAAPIAGGKLTPKDVLDGVPALKTAGFMEVRKGFWQHADSSFVAAVGGQVVFGAQQQVLSSHPSQMPKIKSTSAHSFLAVAQTSALKAGERNLAKKLSDLGFADQGNGLHQHGDGSWVAISAGSLLRGHQGDVFTDVPKPPKPGQHKVFTSMPGGSWSQWQQQFAVARLPLFQGQFTAAEASKVLKRLGFADVGGGTWQHPDGSRITLQQGSQPYFSSSAFQQWDFSQFPYQNGTDGTNLANLTQHWLSWAQSGGTPPF
jgi:hypothetical protein